jgi:diaminohydroxyphosphoribosylaminopyrimidine deaminase/5-amino-6-(5-phosphoribosylamino)uracil reductase
LQLPEHDLGAVLDRLAELEVRHLLVEGGPTLATALLAADAVDELHAYVAPVLLGAGATAVGDLGVTTIGDAARFTTHDVTRLGDDVLLVARRTQPAQPIEPAAATASVQRVQPVQPGRLSRHTKEEI